MKFILLVLWALGLLEPCFNFSLLKWFSLKFLLLHIYLISLLTNQYDFSYVLQSFVLCSLPSDLFVCSPRFFYAFFQLNHINIILGQSVEVYRFFCTIIFLVEPIWLQLSLWLQFCLWTFVLVLSYVNFLQISESLLQSALACLVDIVNSETSTLASIAMQSLGHIGLGMPLPQLRRDSSSGNKHHLMCMYTL